MKAIFFLLAAALAADPSQPSSKDSPRELRSIRSSGELTAVEISLEAGGDLKVRHADKVNSVKMSVVGELAYEERILAYPATEEGTWRSLRRYSSAAATLKIGQNAVKPALRDDRRLIAATVHGTGTNLYCPAGPLSREGLDLLNISGDGIANSLVVDRLLPVRPVAVGQSWPHSRDTVGVLLGLDSVRKSDVQSTFVSEANGTARIQMSGRVEGTSDGAAVQLEVKAKYQVDLKTKRVSWFGLLVRENREIGEVVPGTDVVLRLEMKITPIGKSKHLTDAVVLALPPEPPAEKLDLEHRSADGLWSLAYDRDWYITADERDLTVLKLMDQGERIAQCNVSSLQKVDAAKLPTLAEFQEEVRGALGKSFGEFIEAGQSPNELKYRVYRVVVRGSVNDLPIQWHYYLVADAQGNQAAFAFTLDAAALARLNGADKRLVNQLHFADTKVAAKPTPAK